MRPSEVIPFNPSVTSPQWGLGLNAQPNAGRRIQRPSGQVSLLNAEINALDTAYATRSTASRETTAEHEDSPDHQVSIGEALAAHPPPIGRVVCGRVTAESGHGVNFTQHETSADELDFNYGVAATLTFTGPVNWPSVGLQAGDILVNAALQTLLAIYNLWRLNELRELAHAHELRLRARESPSSVTTLLTNHLCSASCPVVTVVFRAVQRTRDAERVERARASRVPQATPVEDSYTELASEQLRTEIIREWQDAFSTDNFKTSVCAPCGRRVSSSSISTVPPSTFDLSLLRNDDLPEKTLPTTYNFHAYDRALLNPKGLVDRNTLSDVLMCETCHRELVVKRRMPRLCLANHLYYAVAELPDAASRAFADSTYTERLLLARARSSRISYRFSELRKRKREAGELVGNEPNSFDTGSRSQQCVYGNVLIMPQNSTTLNAVLPPPPETIRDTVCAVYVGKTKPTEEVIGKLGPVLVRKTRMLTMIDFVTRENSHYACDTEFHGFSQRNLDGLFGPGTEQQEEGVPCGLEIGFIEDSKAIQSSMTGYANCTESATPEDGGNYPLLMENVGYTMGDESPVSYDAMKMKALSHCLGRGRFVRSRGGDKFIPDFENPSLMTWLFPHLDPWGIGGFHEPNRTVPLTMDEQLRYLLELDDSPFERDPDFAFVYYNILQKKSVCDSVRFKVKAADQTTIVRDLLNVDRRELETMIDKFRRNPKYVPETEGQKKIQSLVNRVGTVLHDLPGTAGYKLNMRNEIRALVNKRGTPAFFITLNPSDVNHPLVRLLSGDDIRLEQLEEGQQLTEWERKELVAKNPAACAKFFHEIISKFISIVLRHGRNERGLLGHCTAYYGTVETQGRGTLHCHMLIWLRDHPSPQQLRDKIEESSDYRTAVFAWLESIIKNELLGTTMLVKEPSGALTKPRLVRSNGYVHPGTHLGPSVANLTPHQFALQFASDVNDVVSNSNWHEHTETCWKYLRSKESRTDENCRMRIDGQTQDTTCIDEESGSIKLRRLHPRIASYNDVIIFLLRANMEIKHIGSGERAKALMYYITDYITKASLPAHVGLAAILYAINRTHEKYSNIPDWEHTRQAGALTVLVNSMMARQEIPHQQVMSYLVGGGDNYKSDQFRILHYGSFERLIRRHWKLENSRPSAQDNDALEASNEELQTAAQATDSPAYAIETTTNSIAALRKDEDNVTLVLGAGSISAVNQLQDYLYRPTDNPFHNMGLYEYVGMTEKVTLGAENRRLSRRQADELHETHRGRPEEPRAKYTPDHPQCASHIVRKRTVWVIPVVLGDSIPRPDRGDEERERWARAMLTLFVPWRHPRDLKREDQSWYSSYEEKSRLIPDELKAVILNMNVLSECKEARDSSNIARIVKEGGPAVDVLQAPPPPDPFDVYNEALRRQDISMGDETQTQEDTVGDATLLRELDHHIGTCFRHAVDTHFKHKGCSGEASDAYGAPKPIADVSMAEIDKERATMRSLKRKRRPDDSEQDGNPESGRNTRRRRTVMPRIDSMQLPAATRSQPSSSTTTGAYDPKDVVYQVIVEKNLQGNAEQLRAFESVARHVIEGGSQLLMYVGGVGGTGKSHVVNSILRLFSLLGKRKNILVAAPTGAAAILIGGHTIHSLTLLPDKAGRDLQELCKIWDGVDYLILDEISMIGARFLSQLNSRLQRAKGYDDTASDVPFGGINIIFTGDFGQLRPVHDPPLFSHKLVSNPELQNCELTGTISALMGAYLWRRVNKVVLLKVNQRQAGDKTYADLLSRVRAGNAKTTSADGTQTDFEVLKTRYANRIDAPGPDGAPFADAPIVVGRKKLRDLLNLRIMGHHARNISATIHLYHARDKISGQFVSEADRPHLWSLTSTKTSDSLGKLPLFPGMKVMVQENLAFTNKVVNGSEGIVRDIVYEEEDGRRYPVVAYVHIPGAGDLCAGASNDIVPIFPEWTTFYWTRKVGGIVLKHSVTRLQLPLLPAYAYTDYKSQGRSLDVAIVDPESAMSLQGAYVMLSRVKALQGLCVLRPFQPQKIEQRLSEELRVELNRLQTLDDETLRTHQTMWPAH